MLTSFQEVLSKVQGSQNRKKCGVVAADDHAIEAALEAEEKGLADPVFIGDEAAIQKVLKDKGGDYEIIPAGSLEEAAALAVAGVREGKLDFLIKGHIDTKILLKAVVNKETGLGTGKLMTHVGFFEIPNYHKLFACTDGGMVTYPDVEQKQGIIENAVETFHKLGYEEPKVAVLTAVEKENPKMPETVDAAELKRRNQAGDLKGCIVEGPISYDLAFSKEAADIKGFESPVPGDVDILVVPTITTGNILGKAMIYSAGGEMAGLIIGAKCPIILTSRASSPEEKLYSVAMAALMDHSE